MKLSDEDLSTVLVSEMPKDWEYIQVILLAMAAGRVSEKGSMEFREKNSQVYIELWDVVARCIARGKRLQREAARSQSKSPSP